MNVPGLGIAEVVRVVAAKLTLAATVAASPVAVIERNGPRSAPLEAPMAVLVPLFVTLVPP